RLCYEVSKNMTDESYPQSKDDRYLYDFIKLLSAHCKTERSVGFYAKKLCITPKYLSSRLRMVSGMSAKEWIDNYLILEIKNLLKYSNMDVKEIAFALHFPNQSFFTQYFKRHTGMLPTEYRKTKD
ncbi:MAG: AraC family transcriptional regulator, partial [Bacteroidales bacterium]|nr:AraC family transcriptional regulator [Bacteroidales bacterium]